MQTQLFGWTKCKHIYKKKDKMWIKCKHNHPIIKTTTNSKTEHCLSCKEITMEQKLPGKIELKS